MTAWTSFSLGGLSLTNNAYADIVETVVSLDRPILATGGGGYHPGNTARGWALAWSILCGDRSITDNSHGLGGVMLESTDWHGGLRDRARPPDAVQLAEVGPAVEATIERVKELVFPLHGL